MYPDQFIAEVTRLSTIKQFLFGLSQAERILHFYESFEEEWEADQPYQVLVDAMEMGYQYALNPSNNLALTLRNSTAEVEKSIPDSDEYSGGTEVTYGQNAALSLYCTLDYVFTKDSELIIEAVGKTIDTVDGIVLDKSDDEKTDTQEFIDREIALQLDFIEYVTNMELTESAILNLRFISQQNRISA